MEINDEINLSVKYMGLVADFTRWQRLTNNISYNDDFDLIDGLAWTGSAETLFDSELWKSIQKVAPEIRFDFGELCGYTDFDYIVIPTFWPGNYEVCVLTNNNTILQVIGYLEIGHDNYYINSTYGYGYRPNNNVSFYFYAIPDENYVPINYNYTESITVNNRVYEYVGFNNQFRHKWVCSSYAEPLYTYYRNPNIDAGAYDRKFNEYSLQDVTYYEGMEPPEDPN